MLLLTLYAALIIIGGIAGYAAAGSKLSLIMGVGFGLLLLASAFAVHKKKKIGAWVALGLIILLDAFFTFRYVQTQRFLPSGLFSLISLSVLLTFAMQIKKQKLK